MSSAIQNILDRALGDVARATKYEVFFAFTDPKEQISKDELIVMGKTASFPGKSHTTIDFRYKGRSIPIKGQTKYTQTWECTFYLTEDHKLKKAFENWIEALDQKHNYIDITEENRITRMQVAHNKNGYTTELYIYQRNFDDNENTAEYILHNAFPIEVSPVQTNYESKGVLQEFTVTFSYSHFTSRIIKGSQGNFIDTLIAKVENYTTDMINGSLSILGDKINGFVSDGIGDSLSQLNSWASGLKIDINNTATNNLSSKQEAAVMGAGPNYLPKTIFTEVEGVEGR